MPLSTCFFRFLQRPALRISMKKWSRSPSISSHQPAAMGWVYRTYHGCREFLKRLISSVLPRSEQVAAPPENSPAEVPSKAFISQLVALLGIRNARAEAIAKLVQVGEASLPLIHAEIRVHADENRLRHLATVCAWLASPAARLVLVEVAQGTNLPARTAALQALVRFPSEPADAPLFHRLITDELQLAQHLLHGMASADKELAEALYYELRKARHRLLEILLQVYERGPIREARRGMAQLAAERQLHGLALLANLLPQPLYRGLEALLDSRPLPENVQLIDELIGPLTATEAIQPLIVRLGLAAFSPWTVAVALRQWHPQPGSVAHLQPHLHSSNPLIRESALALLRQLPVQRPAAYDHLLSLHPSISSLAMTTETLDSRSTARARVHLLKGTALFAETPENTLAAILPIMQEVVFEPAQEIFVKGALGTSLFIVCEGEVSIFDGSRQLATFGKGDFFGELALLDAAPRSATAVAQGPVTTFRLDQEDFYEVMEERPEVLRSILRVLCQRLRHQNEQTPPSQ
jgi:hypothetical protein